MALLLFSLGILVCSGVVAFGVRSRFSAATLAGYRPALRIFTAPDESSLLLYLARMAGEVQVLSEPSGATIFVDDQRQSQITPATLDLPEGKHVIAVVKDGYRREQQEFDVKDGALLRVSFTLAQ